VLTGTGPATRILEITGIDGLLPTVGPGTVQHIP
jgi:hypothetical protein